MVYIGPNNNTTNLEEKETEKEEIKFTELTKYTLEEGEEKEITVDGKIIKLKTKENKWYINNKEIKNAETSYNHNVFVVNNLMFFSYYARQSGDKYNVYDLDGKEKILSESAVKHQHALLSVMLNTAVKWDFIEYNPCSKLIKKPTPIKKNEIL
ncbi:MAG: hypothetical protein IKN63_01405 [Bacilli bacterium]|nr:hypothetical protein [Bacilli bacterium]